MKGLVLSAATLLAACSSPRRESTAMCLDVAGITNPADTSGMIWIPGGATTIGSDDFHPEEAPKRTVTVGGFWIDRHEVTNREFAAFVAATGYRTTNERRGGGAVFHQPDAITNLYDLAQWWRPDPSADWRHPRGSNGRKPQATEPVLQVTEEDALAYARWRGRDCQSASNRDPLSARKRDPVGVAWDD